MAGKAYKVRAEDASEKKSSEMTGCEKADLHRGEIEGLFGNGIERTKRADPHLDKQGGQQESG